MRTTIKSLMYIGDDGDLHIEVFAHNDKYRNTRARNLCARTSTTITLIEGRAVTSTVETLFPPHRVHRQAG